MHTFDEWDKIVQSPVAGIPAATQASYCAKSDEGEHGVTVYVLLTGLDVLLGGRRELLGILRGHEPHHDPFHEEGSESTLWRRALCLTASTPLPSASSLDIHHRRDVGATFVATLVGWESLSPLVRCGN